MIIEHIDKDELIVKDETKRFFQKKRWKFLLSFDQSIKRAHIKFIPDIGKYTIFLPGKPPNNLDILYNDYNLVHEIHHCYEWALMPRWLGSDKRFAFCVEMLNIIDLKKLFNYLFSRYNSIRPFLDEESQQEVSDTALPIDKFVDHIKNLDIPQHDAIMNALEDILIEAHIRGKHKNVCNDVNAAYIFLLGFKSLAETYRDFIRKLQGFAFVELFSIHEFLQEIYHVYDTIAANINKVGLNEYYKEYNQHVKAVLKRTDKRNFAERIRIQMEVERIKKIRKTDNWPNTDHKPL